MIRQNRAVPLLLVFTLAWLLYVAGCFGGAEDALDSVEQPTPVPTTTPAPVVSEAASEAASNAEPEERFVYTIEDGDLLDTIATKFNVTTQVIVRANPGLKPSELFVGQELVIPGATTIPTELIDPEDREEGETSDHVIVSGDTIGAIANEWIVSPEALLEANPGVDPGSLQIGALLVIPPLGTGLPADAIAARRSSVAVERVPGEILYHTVEPGDNLSALAALYSVTETEIMGRNSLTDANELFVGQELLIPPPSETPDG